MLIAAGILVILLGLAHSFLGERYIVGWLLRQDRLPPVAGGRSFAGGTIRFAWHLTTVLMIAIGIALILFDLDASASAIVGTIGWCLIVSGVLPIVFTRGRHPSWLVLLFAGALCVVWAFAR